MFSYRKGKLEALSDNMEDELLNTVIVKVSDRTITRSHDLTPVHRMARRLSQVDKQAVCGSGRGVIGAMSPIDLPATLIRSTR